MKKRRKDHGKQRGMGDTRTRPSKSIEQNSYELTEAKAANTGSTQVFIGSSVYIL